MPARIQTKIDPEFKPIHGPGETITAMTAIRIHAGAIASLINGEHEHSGAVLKVDYAKVSGWISDENSFVAVSSKDSRIVGHIAVVEWPGCFEMRSIVVDQDHQGLGIYREMSNALIAAIFAQNPDAVIAMVKNDKSKNIELLADKGFVEIPIEKANEMGIPISEPEFRRVFALTLGAYQAKTAAKKELR
jgi:N-acetylglutamate synthase-like GNAT family acetyltransferase